MTDKDREQKQTIEYYEDYPDLDFNDIYQLIYKINKHIEKKFNYKNPIDVLCKNCLKKKIKTYMVINNENKKILNCPKCHFWMAKNNI